MRYRGKIRAGALQFVLLLGAVIAVLLLTFVLLNHGHLLSVKKTDRFITLLKRADFVLQQSLQNPPSGMHTPTPQLSDDGITTSMATRPWGVFGITEVTTSFQKNTFTKIALIGGNNNTSSTALFVKDNDRPVIIAGRTQIRGDAHIPKQGIRPGNIAGHSFYGSDLVLGKQYHSTSTLPQIPQEIKNAIKDLLSKTSPSTQSPFTRFDGGELVHPFSEPVLWLNGDMLDLSQKKITGNIIVYGTQHLTVDRSTQLEDVILVAPQITIADGVKGTFQAFATQRIDVGRNCGLHYPSALVIVDQNKGQSPSHGHVSSAPDIHVSNNSVIKGVLCYLSPHDEKYYHPQIKIDEGATIMGQIYCEKNLELKGKVWGQVVTDGFMALENGSVYQNHLYNGTIDATQLPEQYIGLEYGTLVKKGIVKWLY